MSETMKWCQGCEYMLPRERFSKDRSKADGVQTRCKDCKAAYRATYRAKRSAYNAAYNTTLAGLASAMLRDARRRARHDRQPCTITRERVLEALRLRVCSLTGLRWVRGTGVAGLYSPTLDRIDPGAGYTPENTRLVLHAVNTMKGDATDDVLLGRAWHVAAPGYTANGHEASKDLIEICAALIQHSQVVAA